MSHLLGCSTSRRLGSSWAGGASCESLSAFLFPRLRNRFARMPSSIAFSLIGAARFYRFYMMTRLAGLGKCCSWIDMTTTRDCDIVVGMERRALSAWP